MNQPPSDDAPPALDPELLRKIARLLRAARREHGLARAVTVLRAAIREARDDRHDGNDEAAM